VQPDDQFGALLEQQGVCGLGIVESGFHSVGVVVIWLGLAAITVETEDFGERFDRGVAQDRGQRPRATAAQPGSARVGIRSRQRNSGQEQYCGRLRYAPETFLTTVPRRAFTSVRRTDGHGLG
jgi:hypothetical protein